MIPLEKKKRMRYFNYIGGWREPVDGVYSQNRNPHYPEEIIGEFPLSTVEDVREAIVAAKKAFPSWKRLSFPERAAYLKRAAGILKERAEEIGRDLTREEGKTLAEGKGETLRAVSILEFFAGEGFQPLGQVIPSASEQTFLYTTRMPLGPVGLITPWNFPMAIPVWKMAPALLCGNTVVIKPAELTPMSVYHLVDALHEAGIPEGVVNAVFGKGETVGNEIVEHPDIHGISFTGSNQVGRNIQQRATAKGKKVQLELGGKNPLIVLGDADLDKAVEIAVSGAFRSTGQKCTATSRIIVDTGVYEAFRDQLVERTKKLKVGNPLEPDTFMGPCVSRQQRDSVLAMIESGKREADLLVGGGIPSASELSDGYYIQPTIFENVPRDARIAREEIFGPVIALFKVDGYDQALELANETPFGLSASICTNDLTLAHRFAEEIEVGMVHVNSETSGAEPQAPFGGCKNSGTGIREQGKTAIEFYTQVKTVYMDRV